MSASVIIYARGVTMENRVAVISIIVEAEDAVSQLNALLHEFA